MAYKKEAETKERVETVFDVKGELTFWVKTVIFLSIRGFYP